MTQSFSSDRQYDSYVGGGGHGEQSIGYLFDKPKTITTLTYTEGKHFWDGGWWVVGPVVEVDVNGVWTPVFNEFWSPSQPIDGDPDSDHSFETFVASFDPVRTRGIRLTGNAGGQDHFISVGELTVTTLVGTNCPRAEPLTAAGPPPGGGAATTCVSTDTVGVPFDTLTELGLLPEGGGNHDISVIRDGVHALFS